MNEYIVYKSHLKPTKKGQFPDIIYEYIADDSDIGWHYSVTRKRGNAYLFDESEMRYAKQIADFWGMKIKEVN